MAQAKAIRSTKPAKRERRVKVDPEEIRELLDVLETQDPEHWGLIRRTVQRWNLGEIPEVLFMLVKHPELALATLQAAQRRKRRIENPPVARKR